VVTNTLKQDELKSGPAEEQDKARSNFSETRESTIASPTSFDNILTMRAPKLVSAVDGYQSPLV